MLTWLRYHSCSLMRVCAIALLLFSSLINAQETKVRFLGEQSAPFIILDDNQEPSGFLIDLTHSLIAQTGCDATIELVPWARAYEIARTQANVVLMSVLQTPARMPEFQWVGKVHDARAALVGLNDRKTRTLATLEEAKTLRVASVRGYGSANYLLQNGFVEWQNLILATTPEQLWDLLYMERVDLILTNLGTSRYEAKTFGHDKTRLFTAYEIPELSYELQMATSKTTPQDTLKLLQEGLQSLSDNGQLDAIKHKWHMDDGE